jgi:hypothetical protein
MWFHGTKRHLLLSLILLVLLAHAASTQPVGQRFGPQMPFMAVDARSMALGDASVALMDGPAGFQANPGSVGASRVSVATYSLNRIHPTVSLQHVNLSFPLSQNEGLSASAEMLHYGELDFYTRPEVKARGFEFSGAVTYAREVAGDLFAGVQARLHNATTDLEPVVGASIALGLAYAPGPHYRFGLALHGLGTDYEIENPIIRGDEYDSRLPRVLVLGAVFDYPLRSGDDRLVASFQNDKIIGAYGILYRMGLEYQWAGMVATRIGCVVRTREFEPRAGLGITLGPVVTDYAYAYSRRNGKPSHLVSFTAYW